MKNASLAARMGYAWAGIRIVFRREKSFRTQGLIALVQIAVTAAIRPGFAWAALIALCIALVLTLEMVNAALEYLIDRLHPEIHEEIGRAKDAAAGAVLLASIAAACVGALMILDWWLQW
jgi:diacylglycerol kinase (ATP)